MEHSVPELSHVLIRLLLPFAVHKLSWKEERYSTLVTVNVTTSTIGKAIGEGSNKHVTGLGLEDSLPTGQTRPELTHKAVPVSPVVLTSPLRQVVCPVSAVPGPVLPHHPTKPSHRQHMILYHGLSTLVSLTGIEKDFLS